MSSAADDPDIAWNVDLVPIPPGTPLFSHGLWFLTGAGWRRSSQYGVVTAKSVSCLLLSDPSSPGNHRLIDPSEVRAIRRVDSFALHDGFWYSFGGVSGPPGSVGPAPTVFGRTDLLAHLVHAGDYPDRSQPWPHALEGKERPFVWDGIVETTVPCEELAGYRERYEDSSGLDVDGVAWMPDAAARESP